MHNEFRAVKYQALKLAELFNGCHLGRSNKAREMNLYIPSQAVCRKVPQQLPVGCYHSEYPAGNF